MTKEEFNSLQKQLKKQGHTIKLVNNKVVDAAGKPLLKDKESGQYYVHDKIGNRLYFADNGKFSKNSHIKPKGFFDKVGDGLKSFAAKMGEINPPGSANTFVPYQSQGIRTTTQKASGVTYQKANGTYATPTKEQQKQAQNELRNGAIATAATIAAPVVAPYFAPGTIGATLVGQTAAGLGTSMAANSLYRWITGSQNGYMKDAFNYLGGNKISNPYLYDAAEFGFNLLDPAFYSTAPAEAVIKGILNLESRFTPYGFRVGKYAYTPDPSTMSINFPIFKRTRVGNASQEQLKLLHELEGKYSTLPSREDILTSLRNSNGIESIDADFGLIKFGFGKNGEEGMMMIDQFTPEYWPLLDKGISSPIFVQTHMTPPSVDGKAVEMSRAAKVDMVKAQQSLPRGTIFSPSPDVPASKELVEQAIVKSNNTPETKVKLLEEFRDYTPDYQTDFGNVSIDSYDMMASMGRKPGYRTHIAGDTYAFNEYSANPNNPLLQFVVPHVGRSGNIIEWNFNNVRGFSDYLKNKYPHLNSEFEIPSFYLQKKLQGGIIYKHDQKH